MKTDITYYVLQQFFSLKSTIFPIKQPVSYSKHPIWKKWKSRGYERVVCVALKKLYPAKIFCYMTLWNSIVYDKNIFLVQESSYLTIFLKIFPKWYSLLKRNIQEWFCNSKIKEIRKFSKQIKIKAAKFDWINILLKSTPWFFLNNWFYLHSIRI